MKKLPEEFRVFMGMIVLTSPVYKTNTIRKNYLSTHQTTALLYKDNVQCTKDGSLRRSTKDVICSKTTTKIILQCAILE